MYSIKRFAQSNERTFHTLHERAQFRCLPKIAARCGTAHTQADSFLLSLCRLFSLTSFIHFNPFEAGDEPFDGLALDTAGSSTRSKNIISARPRIITLRSGPKNDRHPTSFNHGIMKVDFFHQLSLSLSLRDAVLRRR
jgi:hypothetical protein